MYVFLFFLLTLAGIGLVASVAAGAIPLGSLRVVLQPILASGSCRQGSAGVAAVYLIPYEDIDHTTGITWDADDVATAIPLVATKTWAKYEFEDGSAFFTQAKQTPGSNVNFTQTLSMNFTNNTKDARLALKVLDTACQVVAYIVDNTGATRLGGILPAVDGGGTASRSLKMKTGEGEYTTGADPTADSNLRTVTLVCQAKNEAPYTTVLESALPV